MENFSALLALCAGKSPVTGEFLSQRPVIKSFDVFFNLRLNKRLGEKSWGWWFETPSRLLWRDCNAPSWAIYGMVVSGRQQRNERTQYILLIVHDHFERNHRDAWKRFPHYWLFVRGIHWPQVDSLYKVSITQCFEDFFDASLNKLTKKTNCLWFEAQRCCYTRYSIFHH